MSELPEDTIRDHYDYAREVYEALARVGDNPTIGNNDFVGWYIKEDSDDEDAVEDGFPRRGRVAQLDADLDELLDRLDRTLYAITTYKQPEAFDRWVPCRFEDGQTEWQGEKPTPTKADLRAVPAWGDIDLVDDLKEQRGDLDADTEATIEDALAAYIDEYAELYGTREAVYALDSVGGAYIFGAPEATLPIAAHFEDDDAAIARVMGEFIDRTNDWLTDAEDRVNERVDGAADVIDPDWVNNYNRQYKAPLSIHSSHDAVVTPIDIADVEYSLTPLGDADADLLLEAIEWAEAFTADDHGDCVDHLIETLWPEEYEAEGSWQAALDAWVDEQRRLEEEQERARREALLERERRDNEGIEGLPITPHIQDVMDAIDRLNIEQVAERTIVHQWTDQASGKRDTSGSDKRAFIPTWGPNASGTANYIDTQQGIWVDTGQSHYGTAVEMALIHADEWNRGDGIADGADWAKGVEELRSLGFELPVWTPDAETEGFDQMPYWALRQAAIALEVLDPDDLEEREGDDGDPYLAIPGERFDDVLDAIDDAGLEHGRERGHPAPEERLERLVSRFENNGEEPSLTDKSEILWLVGEVQPEEAVELLDRAATVVGVVEDSETEDERWPADNERDLDALLTENEEDDEDLVSNRGLIGYLIGRISPEMFAEEYERVAEVLDCDPSHIQRHLPREWYRSTFDKDESVNLIPEEGKMWHISGVPLRRNGRNPVLNFEWDVEAILDLPGEDTYIELDLMFNGEQIERTVTTSVFHESREFKKEILVEPGMLFRPGEQSATEALNELDYYTYALDAPRLAGTHHMGLHGNEWVTPEGSLTPDGWTDDPETVYIEASIPPERQVSLPTDRHEYDSDDVAAILRQLPNTRPRERLLPVLGWFYAAPFRPHIFDMEGEFNLLNITGDTGSGKTTTLRYIWRCFGMRGEPFSANDTPFAHTRAMASSNAVPIWYDEYKPGEIEGWKLDAFHTLMRKAATGGIESRGNADKSVDEYSLQAPLVISGEQQIQPPAERRRSIMVTFKSKTTDEGTEYREAYKTLAGEARMDDDGELVIPEDCPDPADHALAYIRYATAIDRETVAERWNEVRREVADYRDIWGSGLELDDLEVQALQTILFGWRNYVDFAEKHGVDADELPGEVAMENALHHVASAVGPGGRRVSHLERFIELMSRASARGYLEEGQEYALVYEGSDREELRFHIDKTYDAISKYVRDHGLDGEDLFNSAHDYRKRISERFDDGTDDMVVSYTQKTPPVGKCAGIVTRIAEEELNFDASAFGSVDEDQLDLPTAGAAPVGRLNDKRGYQTITATVLTYEDDIPESGPEIAGTLKDRTGVVDFVSWHPPIELAHEIEEDGTYLFENALVGEYEGAPQVEIRESTVTDIQEIQKGAGYTGLAETPEDQGDLAANGGVETNGGEQENLDRASDGGTADTADQDPQPDEDEDTEDDDTSEPDPDAEEIEDATGRVRNHLQQFESGATVTVTMLAGQLMINPERAQHALDNLAESGVVMRTDDDEEFEVV